jgi:hypothetical protein
LLRRTGVAGNQSLVGDLLEEFDRGRTSGWFWRQTVAAIWISFASGFRISRLEILASFLGWLLETTVVFLASKLLRVPFGFRAVGVAGIAFAALSIPMSLACHMRKYSWRDLLYGRENELEPALRRWLIPFTVLGNFGAYLVSDVIAASASSSLILVLAFHVIAIVSLTVSTIKKAAVEE